MSAVVLGLVWLDLTLLILWALQVEFARLERERRLREALTPMQQAFVRFKVQINDQLTPVLQEMAKAAAKAAPALQAIGKHLQDAELRRVNTYRKGGT